MSRQEIRAHAGMVGVSYLLHFTRAENLPSIILRGLYPIGRIGEIDVVPRINDQYRWDGHRDGTSVSIGFPNCQMLYKLRKSMPETKWVVLVLSPSILWEKMCAFCRHNAADGRISGQPLDALMTPEAFRSMYDEIEGIASRGDQRLKPYDPTDVQAEVLVFDIIEPQYILGVIFEEACVRDACAPNLEGRKSYLHANNKGMFASRGYARKYM